MIRTLSSAVILIAVAATTGASQTLTLSVTGEGKVTGPGIDCPGDCSEAFITAIRMPGRPLPPPVSVTLTASANTGNYLKQWGGACTGAAPTCTVTITSGGAAAVSVVFEEPASVAPSDSDGDGVPDSQDGCPNTPPPVNHAGCPIMAPPPTQPANTVHVTVLVAKAGSGSVTSPVSPVGYAAAFSCSATCTFFLPANSEGQLVLTATPSAGGVTFRGWMHSESSALCSGVSPTCTLTAGTNPQTVLAAFF